MTAPRQVLKNATYLLTRRCSERRFFLRPSKASNQLFLYILAVAAERFGILVHAFCVLSNHVHCVCTDPRGTLPAFEQYLNALVARSFNSMLGRWEDFWAPSSYSAVTLTTLPDLLDKMAYVIANPASAGLVRRASEWPGLCSSPELIGGSPLKVARPDGFFRTKGSMPATAELRVVPPPGVEDLEDFPRRLAQAVMAREDGAARELAAQGRSFLGAHRALAQNPRARPPSGEPRRGLSPRVAGRDRWKRLEAIGRLKSFLAAYRSAWLEFASGVRGVVFPHGTYWMHVAYGVACAPAE